MQAATPPPIKNPNGSALFFFYCLCERFRTSPVGHPCGSRPLFAISGPAPSKRPKSASTKTVRHLKPKFTCGRIARLIPGIGWRRKLSGDIARVRTVSVPEPCRPRTLPSPNLAVPEPCRPRTLPSPNLAVPEPCRTVGVPISRSRKSSLRRVILECPKKSDS